MHGFHRKDFCLSHGTAEERTSLLIPNTCRINIREEVLFQIVMARNVNDCAVFLEQANPPAPAAADTGLQV